MDNPLQPPRTGYLNENNNSSLPLPTDTQNQSLFVASLKELDLELNQRNAAALEELNKEIDELSEIPLDSSTLPRFKDGIEFTSALQHPEGKERVSLHNNNKNILNIDGPKEFVSIEQKLHDLDMNLATDKTREELDRKLQNILDMSKPYKEQSFKEEAQTPLTPFELMDFGKDSIAAKVVHESFSVPIQQEIHQTPLELNIEEVTKRLQSYKVPLNDEKYRHSVKEEPKIPLPTDYSTFNQNAPLFESNPSENRWSQSRPVPPPANHTDFQSHQSHHAQTQPVDDTRAILNALRTLQDRVGKLEDEKTAARQKIFALEKELTTTRSLLLHHQQASPRSQADADNQNTAKSTIPESSQPEYRISLPIPDRASNNTLRNISEARQRVGDVQDELYRLEQLNQSSSQPNSQPSNPPKKNLETEIEGGFDDPALLFDEILQKNSLELIREAQKVRSPAKAPSISGFSSSHHASSAAPVKAWEAQAHPSVSFKSKSAASENQVGTSEIKKLRESIAADKSLKGALSYDPQIIKEKVLEKIKASVLKPVDGKAKDAPVWKKSESRRSRSTTKESNVSSSTHVRKRAPIELQVPKVASDESNGREMPFIVGRNTGKSFSVTANLQTVFSLLKSHTPEMYSSSSKNHSSSSKQLSKEASNLDPGKAVHVLDHFEDFSRKSHTRVPSVKKSSELLSTSTSVPSMITNQDLKEAADGVNHDNLFQILGGIEDEYRQAKTKYSHLVKQYETISNSMTSQVISDSTGTSTLKAIGEDLRHVIQTMEAKSDQISILRDIITSSKSLAIRKEKNRKKPGLAPQPKRYTMDTATSRSRSSMGPSQKSNAARRARSQSPGRALASLSLLKSTLKVQNALGEPK